MMPNTPYHDACFFPHFPSEGILERFAWLDKARQCRKEPLRELSLQETLFFW
jgi:hypothetical protein